MAIKISAMTPAAAPVADTDLFESVVGGVSKSHTGAELRASDANSNTRFGTSVGTPSTGTFNILYGKGAGSNYTTSESKNVVVGLHPGVATESNITRIGYSTTGTSQQNACYIDGITAVNANGAISSLMPILIDGNTGQIMLGNTYVSTQIGTAYTPVTSDANQTILFTNASAVTVTVPNNTTAAFPVNTRIEIIQAGAGQVSFVAAGGVTLNSEFGNLKIANQYSGATWIKTAINTWLIIGKLSA